MNDKAKQLTAEIQKICASAKLDMQAAQNLSIFWGALQAVESIPQTTEETELVDILPALTRYQHTRSISDYRALCKEVEQFCHALYASTENEEERAIYNNMVAKLPK